MILFSDFDKTLTDMSDLAVVAFVGRFEQNVSALTDLRYADRVALTRRARREVAENPMHYGWRHNGLLTAAASVDPFVELRAVAEIVLAGRFEESRMSRLLDRLFMDHGSRVSTPIRPEMIAALQTVQRLGHEVYIVTNSDAGVVQGKLRAFGANGGGENRLQWLIERVRGRAYKGHLLPADRQSELRLPGLSRPMYVGRDRYLETLDTVRHACGLPWSEVVVIGDIFELDLAMPFSLGATVGLLYNERTPSYELEFIRANRPRAQLIESPRDVLAFFER